MSADEQVCPECGGSLHVMGHEKRRELVIIPAQVKNREHVHKVYACRDCEKDECGVPIIKAPIDEPVLLFSTTFRRSALLYAFYGDY